MWLFLGHFPFFIFTDYSLLVFLAKKQPQTLNLWPCCQHFEAYFHEVYKVFVTFLDIYKFPIFTKFAMLRYLCHEALPQIHFIFYYYFNKDLPCLLLKQWPLAQVLMWNALGECCKCHIYTFAMCTSLASQQPHILAMLASLASQQTNVLATFASLANVVSTYSPKYTLACMIRYVVLCTKYVICIKRTSLHSPNLPNLPNLPKCTELLLL